MLELTPQELSRYSRHLILPEVGREGQTKLKNSRVLCAGTGGLGSPISLYLAAAGVGTLGLADFDVVDETNLQRQIVHSTRDVHRPKIASARDRLGDLNPHINIETFETYLDSKNALDIFKDFDVIADGTDNFASRYLINDACVLLNKPNVYGAVFRFEGQATVFHHQGGPCLRCLYPVPPPPGSVPNCAQGGVLGVLAGIIGCIQANEVIKVLLNGGTTLAGRLLFLDAWKMKFRELNIPKDPLCPICGEHRTIHELTDEASCCGSENLADDIPIENIEAAELKRLLDEQPETVQVIDVREPAETALGMLPRSRLVPLGQVVERKEEFDANLLNVFVCKVGIRSVSAIQALYAAGFTGRMVNLNGGTDAWARDVDESFVVY